MNLIIVNALLWRSWRHYEQYGQTMSRNAPFIEGHRLRAETTVDSPLSLSHSATRSGICPSSPTGRRRHAPLAILSQPSLLFPSPFSFFKIWHLNSPFLYVSRVVSSFRVLLTLHLLSLCSKQGFPEGPGHREDGCLLYVQCAQSTLICSAESHCTSQRKHVCLLPSHTPSPAMPVQVLQLLRGFRVCRSLRGPCLSHRTS